MNINWSKLVTQGRAKAIGIPWSPEELKAVYELKIPAEYVRQGIMTLAQLETQKKKEAETGVKPLYNRTLPELMKIAKGLKINVTPDVPKEILIAAILNATTVAGDPKAPKPKKVEKPAPVEDAPAPGTNTPEAVADLPAGSVKTVGDGSANNDKANFLGKPASGGGRKILK